MKTGVIMATLGGPRNLEEIPEFIENFVGRELPAPATNAVIERYRLIGGFSPITHITGEQAQKLNKMLGDEYLCLPAFRYSRPFIENIIEKMADLSVTRILFLTLSPFYTSVTTGNYIDAAKTYVEKTSLAMPVKFIHSWYKESLFIDSWVEKIKNESFDEKAFYIFSAHSLPEKFASEPYGQQIKEAVTMVVSRAGIKNHVLGWQSIPDNTKETWITPTVEERIDEIATRGFQRVILVPIGFTSDHIETLYDIDIMHKHYAMEKGLSFRRITSLNAGEPFIKALKRIITDAAVNKQ